ncbi:Zn-binding domain-containing protein [Nostoc sp. 'Peltigera membranacea cyanobiont' 213]|uniref:Zn-binding domain-containing protein n=1 Tax=Nostoc sp. 'Peltigera membranacea cyanobiont' 213 TaxID=2014530 RepID=UPI001CB90ED8|nr:DUF1998 domain-containing protein [Nostoc sp. 'Peltigera membranacea cyanobiont' 213]
MTNNKPTDYAALIRAANQTVPEPPEWLTVGNHIYSPEYGVGEVMALLGRRLIVKFVEEVNPTQFDDWEEAIALGSIKSSNANLVSSKTLLEETNAVIATVSERIQQIPHLAFQSVTQEGGNGAAEAIFSDLPNFADKAYALAAECDCEAGCPRCLHSTGCPQHNEALHKDLGLFLLDAISQSAQNSQ